MNATPRTGMVLPLAIVAIVLLGVAAATGSFIQRADTRVIHGTHLHSLASTESELAAVAALDDLASAPPLDLPAGASLVRRHRGSDPAARTTVRITRLGERIFSILSVTEVDGGGGVRARDANQLLARIDAVDPPLSAALATREPAMLGDALVDGRDTAQDPEHCPPPATDDAPTASPPDSSALDSMLAVLRSRATKRYPPSAAVTDVRPVLAGGECDNGHPGNWGDPSGAGACASYLPVVHAAGDLSVDGGMGQGVLIVDGDLELGGAFEFAGLIVVGGRLSVVGGGATVSGGVVAGTADLSAAVGEVIMRRSTCRVRRALLAAAPLVPLVERPWASVR